jgi:DinB superfamily
MDFALSQARLILERTPAVLHQMLFGLPEACIKATEGADTWSCYSVVGHLIHAELTDWVPRIRMILEHGNSRTFEPFDRFAQFQEDQNQPLGRLLGRFADLRNQNLEAVARMNLTSQDLDRLGVHPALGGVTLEQLISSWVVHDLTHISQVSRVLAKQYDHEVGPWKAYLSILNR